jgi:uncharacterized protein (DUF58 family)
MSSTHLIDPALLRRLELLSLASYRRLSSSDVGDRLSRRRGSSIEFSDFREYRPGDDLRYVDWKAYGRLEKLFLKLYQDEEDIRLHLLIDASKSMSYGEPLSKWEFAKRAAAAIGFIALHENNRVDAASFSTELSGRIPPLRGDAGLPSFFRALDRLAEPTGETKFGQTVRQYAESAPPAGLVIIFSDFFDQTIADGLRAMAARRHDVVLVQVLDRVEVNPNFVGDFTLMDSETGFIHDVTISESEMSEYQARFEEYRLELKKLALKYGMDFVLAVTDEPIDDLVLHSLRDAGILK